MSGEIIIAQNRETSNWQVCIKAVRQYKDENERLQAIVNHAPPDYWLILAEFTSKRRACEFINYLNGGDAAGREFAYELDD